MAGPWDDFGTNSEVETGPWSSFGSTENKQQPKQNQGIAGDTLTGLKRGVEQMPGMLTGIADIAAAPFSAATGINRPFSRGADWFGEKTGFQPGKWAEEAGQEYSPELQQQLRNVEEAKGFFPTIGAIAQNPRVAANLVAESLPSTIAGGLLARGAMGAVAGAEKLAAMKAAGDTAGLLKAGAIAGGIGEGAVTAGQQMAQTDYNVDPLLAAGTSLASGAITGAIGAGSGRLANSAIGKKLGLSDLETSIAAGTLGQNAGKAGALGYAKRIGAGAAQEGLLEEAPQSYQEQVWQNIANGKPWNEGAAEAAAQGAVAGGLMGGGINAIPRATPPQDQAPANPPVVPPANPNVVEVPTATGSVPIDRTAGPISAAVHAGVSSDAIPTAQPVTDTTADPFERLATLELLSEQRVLTPQEEAEANALSAQIDNESVVQNEPQVTATAEPTTATAEQSVADLSGDKLTKEWTAFSDDSGSLGIPRSQMPQIKAEHRGAMTQFMNARGVQHTQEEVAANSLKPTQAEFSPAKVKKAIGFDGGDRSILVSSDNYVLDGHHQWLAKLDQGEPIKVIRLDAPINDLIQLAHDFPSSETAKGASNKAATTAEIQRRATAPAQQTTTSPLAQTATRLNLPATKDIKAAPPAANRQSKIVDLQQSVKDNFANRHAIRAKISNAKNDLELADARGDLEAVYATSENLKTLVGEEVADRINNGKMPVFKSGGLTFAVHPATDGKNEWQVTTYNDTGALGDTRYSSIEQAISDSSLHTKTLLDSDTAELEMQRIAKAEGEYQQRKAQNIPTNPVANVPSSNTGEVNVPNRITGGNVSGVLSDAFADMHKLGEEDAVKYWNNNRQNLGASGGQRGASVPKGPGMDGSTTNTQWKLAFHQKIDELSKTVGSNEYAPRNAAPQQEGGKQQAEGGKQQVEPKQKAAKKAGTGPQSRDDLVGAILRVTGGNGIHSKMAQTIVGDKANAATKVRGLFTLRGQEDLGDIAELLRVEENYDVRDGEHLAELVREQAAGNAVHSMERVEKDASDNEVRKYREDIRKRASELGIKTAFVKFDKIETEVLAVELKQAQDEEQAEREAIQAANEVSDETINELSQLAAQENDGRYINEEWITDEQILDAFEPVGESQEEQVASGAGEVVAGQEGGGRDERGKAPQFDLAAQTPAQLKALADKNKAAEDLARKEQLAAIRAERAAKNKAEKDRRAAQVIAEREAAKKAEVDALAQNFDLGQQAPEAVDRRVDTEQARGQQDVFAQNPVAQQNQGSMTLMKDGIEGNEIPADSVPNGSAAFQYALGKTQEDGVVAIFRRRADERGSYGGWRWEADKEKQVKPAPEPKDLTLNRGDQFKDGQGKTWQVWTARTGLIEAFPVIDGKMKVSNQDGVRFAIDARSRFANPEARTDVFPIPKERPTEGKNADIEKGLRGVAERQVAAQNKFIDSVMEQFGLSKGDAGKAWDYFVSNKLVNVDAVGGQYTLKDGRMWDAEAMRRAANGGEAVEQKPAQEPQSAEQKIRAAMEVGDQTIGKIKPITIEHNGVTQNFIGFIGNPPSLANQRKGLKTPFTLARIKAGKMIASLPKQLLVENYTLNGRDVLEQVGNARVATDEDIKQWRDAGFAVPEIKPAQEASQKEEVKPAFDYDKAYQERLAYLEKRAHNFGREKIRTEARDGLSGMVLGREFGESVEDYFSRRPDLKARHDATKAWLDGKKPAVADAKKEAKTDDRDHFTLDRLNRDTDKMEPVTFARGEYVRYVMSGNSEAFGEIDGISNARREFSVDGLWYPFGAAYKATKPEAVKPAGVPMSSVIERANKKYGAGLTDSDRVPTAYSFDEHKDFRRRLFDGDVSADELKATYRRYLDSQESLKAELSKKTLKELAPNGTGGRNKGEIVDLLVRRLADVFNISDQGISYSPFGGETYASALGKRVASFTQADMDKFVQYASESRAEREEAKNKALASADNPQSLDDYRNLVALKGEDALTAEQKRHREDLKAEKSMTERAAQEKAKPVVAAVAQTTGSEIRQTKHTKTGEDLYVVVPAARVESDTYKTWNAAAKKLGGWYSPFRGAGAIPGFQFKTMGSAEAFHAYISEGDTGAAQAAANERSAERKEETSGNAVERLTAMADRIEESANADLNRARRTNTARRARMASGAEAAARKQAALAQTMRNLAGAIESGEAKFLGGLRTKAQIEQLMSAVQSAHDDMLRAKYPSYGDFLKHQGEKATAESVDKAKFPVYEAFVGDLMGIADKLSGRDGSKLLAAKLRKIVNETLDAEYADVVKANPLKFALFKQGTLEPAIFGTEVAAHAAMARSKQVEASMQVVTIGRGKHVVTVSRGFAIADKRFVPGAREKITLNPSVAESMIAAVESYNQGKSNYDKVTLGWWLPEVQVRRRRLAAMNIKNGFEYRAALREFIKFREEAKEADKTKELERALIGKNVGVDFFPTPAGVAADMVQRAGIEPDMAVLEPSAGNGNIAEAIKAAGADPDTAEISGDLRELLEAKGFNVVASDFFGMSPRDFTYGDVFRAPDGQLGVMRGSGGMGSGRVGFLPLDANGAPDRSARTWQDRDELVGAEKRGSESGYDRIVMNPPFGNGADIDHVRHAFSLLKPGGRIVSIVGEGAFTRSDKKATEFRDWLESLGAEIESLPENTFRDPKLMATTGANARIVTIDKPETKETDKGTALYSRSNGEEQSTMQKAQATSIIDRILGDKITKALIDAGLIRMVDSEAQIPGGSTSIEAAGQVLGATMPDGTIYLNLGALNEGNIEGVFKHEGFHSAARSWLGEQSYSALMKRLEQLRNVAQSKIAHGRALSAWYEKATAAIPQDTREQDKLEELAGYAIEMHANGTEQPSVIRKWVEDFLSALRTAIIKHMPNGKVKLWALNNLKPQDLARMAVAGMKAKANGMQAQAREAMAYSQSLPTTINVDGTDRPTTNSNGKPIHPTEEGIRNFWKWFAGSKVVDAQGRPLVVYHSSLEDIERFNKTGKFMGHTGTSGISVTDNPEMANRYLDRYGTTRYDGKLFDKNMMALYVKAENPLYRDEPFQTNLRLGAPLPSGYVSPAVRLGYDSLIRSDAISRKGIVKHSDAKNAVKGREIVVFSPEQIKSATGNTGAFSPTNPDIRYSRSGNAPAQPANQPQPSGPWQQAKAKFNTLVSPEAIDTLIYNFQDKYIDLKNVIDRIKEMNGTINDLNDARLGEETYHSKVMKKTKDFTNNEIRPLLQQLLNNGIQKEDFEQYLHARHAPEANAVLAERNPNQQMIVAGQQKASADLKSLQSQLSAAQASGSATKSIEDAIEQAKAELAKWSGAQAFQGTEAERNSLSGMSDQDAAQIIAAVPAGKLAAMQSAAAKVDAIQAKTLAELEKMGLMDKAALDAWRNEYQHYVPLHRDEAHPDSVSHPVGQGFSVKGDASKRRVGSNEKVTNILGHIAMQREAAIVRGEKNSVSKRMYLLAKQNPIRDFWQVDRPPMTTAIDSRTGFVRSQVDPTYKNKPNVLMVRIAGKDAAIVFNEHNPEAVRLAGALKNLDGQDLDVVERTIGSATRWIASVNTQYNPIFGLINFARDVQTGVLNLTSTDLKDKKAAVWKETMRLFKEITKAGFNLDNMNATDKALWEDFQDNGGATGYRDMFANPEDRAKALDKELTALGRSNSVKRMVAIADWLSNYNESMENVVRMAAYKVGLQNGMSKERAASLAKNLTVNFNRKGSKAQKLGAFYAFFNASVQGTARMAQTLKGPVGKKIIIGGIALGVMQQMLGMLFMGGGDDDEWDKIPDFVKERSMIFPTGKDTYVSIPMPLGFNALPNIGRLMTEWAVGGQDKPTAKQIGKLFNIMLSSLNPVGGNDLVDVMSPTVSDPVVSLLRNKDWTGRPIYREDMASLDPTPGFTRAKDTATPWAKGMSYVVNMATGGTNYQPGAVSWTPDQIDYVIGQLTGGAGREIGKFAQTISAPFSGDELPMHKVPLVGRVVGSTAGVSGQSERFYENIKTLNGIEREIKGLAKAGEDVDSYIAGEPKSLLVGLANASESQVKKLREAQRMLKKEGDTAGAKELDVVVAGIMKGLNTEVRAANR